MLYRYLVNFQYGILILGTLPPPPLMSSSFSTAGLIADSLRKQPSFFTPGPSGVSREGRLRFTAENSILMT